MKIVEYAKAHPWTTGVIVLGGGLVFVLLAGLGGGGSAPAGDSGPSDAEIAAQAQIAAAQIQAQAAQAQAGAQLQAATIGAGVQMNSDKLESEVAMRALEVQQSLGLSETEANRQIGLATIDAQKTVAVTQSNNQVATQNIIASVSKSNAKQASKSSMFGSIASIAGAALSIFSDERLKENVTRIGTSEYGYGIYEFNYIGDNKRRRGVIAQEVEQYRPDFVSSEGGFYKVKPQALAR
jgi:hypothetical protein